MRDLPVEIINEYTSKDVKPIVLVEAIFDSGPLRLWSGYGETEYNGNIYTGAGTLLGVTDLEETQDTEARGIVVTLNGIPSTIIAVALGEKCRGRPFRMYLGVMNSGVLTGVRVFAGLMDVFEITDNGETSFCRLSVENILIVGQRAKVSRYTPEDQRKRFPNDKGLEFINTLQDKEVVW